MIWNHIIYLFWKPSHYKEQDFVQPILCIWIKGPHCGSSNYFHVVYISGTLICITSVVDHCNQVPFHVVQKFLWIAREKEYELHKDKISHDREELLNWYDSIIKGMSPSFRWKANQYVSGECSAFSHCDSVVLWPSQPFSWWTIGHSADSLWNIMSV